jgi:hypothetical protein
MTTEDDDVFKSIMVNAEDPEYDVPVDTSLDEWYKTPD